MEWLSTLVGSIFGKKEKKAMPENQVSNSSNNANNNSANAQNINMSAGEWPGTDWSKVLVPVPCQGCDGGTLLGYPAFPQGSGVGKFEVVRVCTNPKCRFVIMLGPGTIIYGPNGGKEFVAGHSGY